MENIRIGHTLSNGEKHIVAARKNIVHRCITSNNIECLWDEIPNIAIIGSGGGERAMVGLLASLYEMGKADLLDSIMYLAGVSGSTWCMAAIYEDENWSSRIKQVKDKVIQRLCHDSVGLLERETKLLQYWWEKEHFTLTDFWAAMIVPSFVKKIDETTLSQQQQGHEKDPFPIYTVIDSKASHGKYCKDPFFELSPHEAGYSLNGAFVKTPKLGCRFNKATLVKEQPEMDMLFLQGLCGSALADLTDTIKKMIEWLEDKCWFLSGQVGERRKESQIDANEGHTLLLDLMKLKLNIASGQSWQPEVMHLKMQLQGKKHINRERMQLSKDFDSQSESIDGYVQRTTSYISQSFFSWYPDLKNEKYSLFLEVLKQVNEMSPESVFIPNLLESPSQGILATASHGKERDFLGGYINRVKDEMDETSMTDGQMVLLTVLELGQSVLSDDEGTHLVGILNKLLKGKKNLRGEDMEINVAQWTQYAPSYKEKLVLKYLQDASSCIGLWFEYPDDGLWVSVLQSFRTLSSYIQQFCAWGTTYNFLCNMEVEEINAALLDSPTRNLIDAGCFLNSPYFSVLRSERQVDLIISLDFSYGDPMETVVKAGDICEHLNIPFPKVKVDHKDTTKPRDFYVFKSKHDPEVPTVIHMPLFNVDNCGDKLSQWQQKYTTFQGAYNAEMIEPLVKKAGENITNNIGKLLNEINWVIQKKRAQARRAL